MLFRSNVKAGMPKQDDAPVKNSSGVVVTACYKGIATNCDTLGALYSAETVIGKTTAELISSATQGGDSDGDGYDDNAVRQALIDAGYDPNIYTITPAYDPVNGIIGQIEGQKQISEKATKNPDGSYTNPDGTIVKPNITYTIDSKGDTTYTPGANGKILIPDLSKINVKIGRAHV